jgi:hypothetical protein
VRPCRVHEEAAAAAEHSTIHLPAGCKIY